jgi:hypothetical protein
MLLYLKRTSDGLRIFFSSSIIITYAHCYIGICAWRILDIRAAQGVVDSFSAKHKG